MAHICFLVGAATYRDLRRPQKIVLVVEKIDSFKNGKLMSP